MADLTAPLTELLTLLGTVDVDASMDPAAVNPPAGWLAVDELHPVTLARHTQLRCSLYLVAPDTDPLRAFGLLGPVLDRVLSVLTPDGDVTTQGVVLPGDPTPLPALRVPVYLTTT